MASVSSPPVCTFMTLSLLIFSGSSDSKEAQGFEKPVTLFSPRSRLFKVTVAPDGQVTSCFSLLVSFIWMECVNNFSFPLLPGKPPRAFRTQQPARLFITKEQFMLLTFESVSCLRSKKASTYPHYANRDHHYHNDMPLQIMKE